MTWTYTTAPLTVPRDAVRLFVGDLNKDKQLLQDEEIAWFLQQQGNRPMQAAIMACEALANRYAGDVDISLGKLSLSNSQRSPAYKARADELRQQLGSGGGGGAAKLLVSGTTYSGRRMAQANRDLIQPVTEVGGDEGYGYGSELVSRWA